MSNEGSSFKARATADVSRQLLHKWRKDPEFREREESVREELRSIYLGYIRAAAAEGNVTAAIFRLKSLYPEEFDDAVRAARLRTAFSSEQSAPTTLVFKRGPDRPSALRVIEGGKEPQANEG